MGYGLDPYTPIKKSYQIKFIVILLQNILHKTQNKKNQKQPRIQYIHFRNSTQREKDIQMANIHLNKHEKW